MTTHQIFVVNIKRGGCMNSITTALQKLNGIKAVAIYKDKDKVSVSSIAGEKETIVTKLSKLSCK
jgi:copper chaperone CopZ